MCFNTQPPEGGCIPARSPAQSCRSFNTQPPEGGCLVDSFILLANCLFQHTAARRRLLAFQSAQTLVYSVSTHSRPKAAAYVRSPHKSQLHVSTHSRPKADAAMVGNFSYPLTVSTHSRPKADAHAPPYRPSFCCTFQHTAARRRLHCYYSPIATKHRFQHTAARRRLLQILPRQHQSACFNTQPPEGGCAKSRSIFFPLFVSTHSRPKAAAYLPRPVRPKSSRFNTQPPEGGCVAAVAKSYFGDAVSTHSRPKAAAKTFADNGLDVAFQHTAARRRLHQPRGAASHGGGFNTQPPEGGCGLARIATHYPYCFNTQPPEGGCPPRHEPLSGLAVSTHSRPKAAAINASGNKATEIVSTHSRPKAAARALPVEEQGNYVSTHSRPKAAA